MPEELAPMAEDAEQLNPKIERAVAEGQLMESTAKNIHTLLVGARYYKSIATALAMFKMVRLVTNRGR